MDKTNKESVLVFCGMVIVGLVVMMIARMASGPVTSIGGASTPTDWFILGCLAIVAALSMGVSLWSFATWAIEKKGGMKT